MNIHFGHGHEHKKSRVLFLLKYRQLYMDVTFNADEEKMPYSYFSSGLLNSARQVNQMLIDHNVESKLVQVIDNNCIDREVTQYKPTDVIIEALWVVPEKFEVLQKLHPHVRWIVRLHSETPFMASEGIAMDWILRYMEHKNVYVGVNSPRMLADLKGIVSVEKEHKLLYLPNYYDIEKNHAHHPCKEHDKDILDISCFGAIRPLKNQLLQAMAAIKFAKDRGMKLRFHINGSRIESNGDNILKNIRATFAKLDPEQYTLVEHSWKEPEHFRALCAKMDLAMQVSLSETYNIVVADAIAQNVPIVVSNEVPWASWVSTVDDPTKIESIVDKMHIVLQLGQIGVMMNKHDLNTSNKRTIKDWLLEFKS